MCFGLYCSVEHVEFVKLWILEIKKKQWHYDYFIWFKLLTFELWHFEMFKFWNFEIMNSEILNFDILDCWNDERVFIFVSLVCVASFFVNEGL